MGCCHSKDGQLEIDLFNDVPSKNQVFVFSMDTDAGKNVATLSENALLDGKYSVVKLQTSKNDIDPITKEEQLKLANRISRHAIKKIPMNQNGQADKIKVDPKLIKKAIKST